MKRRLAIAWLVTVLPLTGVVCVQEVAIYFGMFDPVRHDQLPPERLPQYVARQFGFASFGLITSLMAARILKRSQPHA